MSLIKETFLFIVYFLCYLTQFLKGLRIFSESYSKLLNTYEQNERIYWNTDLKNTNDTTEFIKRNRNEALRLLREHEKMFNQLFSIFISTMALIIAILALVVNMKK